MKKILLVLIAMFVCSHASAQESLNNLPLPRFASLASDKVNLRVGPGERYPIDWVIKQKSMPVEITQEFENWRKVKLNDGTVGWAHRAMLSGTRYGLVKGGSQLLHRQPDKKTAVQAKAQKGALIRLEKCQKDWCFGSAQGFEGWLPKTAFWGAYLPETFD
jgi:SH3-like domain-containing protein